MKKFSALSLFIGIVLWQCERVSFQQMKAIPDLAWHMDTMVKFSLPIQDTTALYDFYMLISHANDYPYMNLYCFVNSLYPGDSIKCDTVNFILADEQGNWLGKKRGKFYEHEILIARKVRFEQPGVYAFEFYQGMRDTILHGIHAIGIKLVKY